MRLIIAIRLKGVYITDIAAWCNIMFGDYYDNPLRYAHNLYLNNELVTELVIPDGVTSIGKEAFDACSYLKDITYKGTKAEWQKITKGEDWISYYRMDFTVHCTDGDLERYEA